MALAACLLGLLGALFDAHQRAVLGTPLADLDEPLVAGQFVERVEDERHVVEIQVDAQFGNLALLAQPEEQRRDQISSNT